MAYKLLLLPLVVNVLSAYTVTFGGELYRDGQSANNIGMGGYSTSFSNGTNPALLIHSHISSVHFSHKNKFAGLAKVSSLSYIQHVLIQGNQYPIYYSIINRSVNHIPDTRDAISSDGIINYANIKDISQQEIGLSVATIYNINHFTIGLNIKPFHTGLAEFNAWGISGDIGAILPLLNNRMELGCHIANIFSFNSWGTGTMETFVPLVMVGGQIQLASLLLGIEAGSRLEDNSQFNYHAGFEFYQQNEIIILRGGVSHNWLFSAGIGLHLNVLQFDYAFTQSSISFPFEPSHIISLGILFDKLNRLKGKILP